MLGDIKNLILSYLEPNVYLNLSSSKTFNLKFYKQLLKNYEEKLCTTLMTNFHIVALRIIDKLKKESVYCRKLNIKPLLVISVLTKVLDKKRISLYKFWDSAGKNYKEVTDEIIKIIECEERVLGKEIYCTVYGTDNIPDDEVRVKMIQFCVLDKLNKMKYDQIYLIVTEAYNLLSVDNWKIYATDPWITHKLNIIPYIARVLTATQ